MKKLYPTKSSLALMGVLLTPTLFIGLGHARDQQRGEDSHPRFAQNSDKKGGPGRGEGQHGRGMRGGPMASVERMKLRRIWRGIGQLEEGKLALNKAQAKRVVDLVRPWTARKTMTDAEAGRLADQLRNTLTVAQKQELEKMGPGGRDGRGPGGPGGPGRGEGGGPGKGEGRGPGGPGGPGKGEGRGAGGPGGPGKGEGRGPGGPGGREGRGPGGPGGMDPKKMEAMRKFMSTLNPFYAPTGYAEWKSMPERMQQGLNRRYQAGRATLEALSRKSR